MKRIDIKPGRTAAGIGFLFGVMAIVFGLFWIGLASRFSQPGEETEPGVVMLTAFGVMFVVAATAITVFYARSAFGKKRPSILDVEEAAGEGETGKAAGGNPAFGEENRFCPFCGKPMKKEFVYCGHCGKKMA